MPWMKLCPWDTRTVVLSSTVTLQSKDSLLQKKELMQSLKKGLISWSEERYGCIKLHYCFKVHTALCFNSSFMQILFFYLIHSLILLCTRFLSLPLLSPSSENVLRSVIVNSTNRSFTKVNQKRHYLYKYE